MIWICYWRSSDIGIWLLRDLIRIYYPAQQLAMGSEFGNDTGTYSAGSITLRPSYHGGMYSVYNEHEHERQVQGGAGRRARGLAGRGGVKTVCL